MRKFPCIGEKHDQFAIFAHGFGTGDRHRSLPFTRVYNILLRIHPSKNPPFMAKTHFRQVGPFQSPSIKLFFSHEKTFNLEAPTRLS